MQTEGILLYPLVSRDGSMVAWIPDLVTVLRLSEGFSSSHVSPQGCNVLPFGRKCFRFLLVVKDSLNDFSQKVGAIVLFSKHSH